MLVLTRREGECIRIDNNIVVRVHTIGKKRVRIAIEAPHDVPIYREEIYNRIAEENLQASKSNLSKEGVDDLFAKLGLQPMKKPTTGQK